VLDTLVYLKHETPVWLEITTLLIPGHNDSDAEIVALSQWITKELGPDVPLHFSAFHPDHKMPDVPATPMTTLVRAREVAINEGVNFVYTGNVRHREGDTTFCPQCHAELIERDWYAMRQYRLTPQGHCQNCGTAVAGRYAATAGNFGRNRIPIAIGA
jgi:pyruvate formate lyase activating enzyme